MHNAVSAQARLEPAEPPERAMRVGSIWREEEGCLELSSAWESPPLGQIQTNERIG